MVSNRIRFGLAAVKNVGGSALDSIMEKRGKDGPFCSLADFCSRVDLRRVIESLIKAGAFDSFGARRSQLFAVLDQAQSIQKEKMSGQMSLFSIMPADVKAKAQSIPLPDIEEWPEKMRLAFEKETVGFYITGHPLNDFKKEIAMVADVDLAGLTEWPDNHPVRVGGLVRIYKEHKSKKGERMCFMTLEDLTGAVDVVVFPDVFASAGALLEGDEPLNPLFGAKPNFR